MATNGAVLVVGGDSMLGAVTASQLAATGVHVIPTSRRGTPGSLPLDLAASPSSWTLPEGISAAVLCAAVTSTEECRRHPEVARLVNVEATAELAHRLAGNGARVMLLSTNLVFDGTLSYTPAEATRCPRTAYGRMKAEAEEAILQLGEVATVVRLTKVLGQPLSIVMRWREALNHRQTVRPLADLTLAPVSPSLAAGAITEAVRSKLSGILQVSATSDVSYADVAGRLASIWGFPGELVQPTTIAEAGVILEHVPRHTTLDTTRLRLACDIEPPDPWQAVEAAAGAVRTGRGQQ